MEPLTPESLAKLREQELMSRRYSGERAVCIAPDELIALLDAAARLADVEAERDALAAKVERVRAMHRERPYADPELRTVAPSLPAFVCQHCWGQAGVAVPHPCPTIRALDGTETDHA